MATKTITETQLGWVAGIIDLKAKIVTKNNSDRSSNSKQIVMYVETKQLSVIKELNRLTGTKVELHTPRVVRDFMRKKCTEHCPEKHSHVEELYPHAFPSSARWTITGSAIAIILTNVADYLTDKKNYPELIDKIIDQTVLSGQGSARTLASIRRLSLLGWTLPEQFEVAMA
jgi:hypothetical protein